MGVKISWMMPSLVVLRWWSSVSVMMDDWTPLEYTNREVDLSKSVTIQCEITAIIKITIFTTMASKFIRKIQPAAIDAAAVTSDPSCNNPPNYFMGLHRVTCFDWIFLSKVKPEFEFISNPITCDFGTSYRELFEWVLLMRQNVRYCWCPLI